MSALQNYDRTAYGIEFKTDSTQFREGRIEGH
jgi:hypothetical protein